jgi:hypothetical protein
MAIKRNLSTPLAPSIFDKEKRKARKERRKARREHRDFLKGQHEEPVRRSDLDKKGKAIYDKNKN